MTPFTTCLSRLAGLLLAASAAVATSTTALADDGVFHASWFGHRVTGSGKTASESRAVTGFQAIALQTSVNLVLRQGTREGIELRGDDNILPLIETTVVERNGVPTLEIAARKGITLSSRTPIVATVDLVTLRALSIRGSGEVSGDVLKTPALRVAISGSGDVKLKQLLADEVSAQVSGSGDIEFGGRSPRLSIAISGSGDVKARGLDADDVTVSIAGSGDADVTAHKTLSVSIAGVGDVKYAGEAAVKSSIAGQGSVTRR